MSRLRRQVPGEAQQKAQQPAASFSAVPVASPDEQRLSWRALRSVGAGFWLTDPQLLRCACEGHQLPSCSDATLRSCHKPYCIRTTQASCLQTASCTPLGMMF